MDEVILGALGGGDTRRTGRREYLTQTRGRNTWCNRRREYLAHFDEVTLGALG